MALPKICGASQKKSKEYSAGTYSRCKLKAAPAKEKERGGELVETSRCWDCELFGPKWLPRVKLWRGRTRVFSIEIVKDENKKYPEVWIITANILTTVLYCSCAPPLALLEGGTVNGTGTQCSASAQRLQLNCNLWSDCLLYCTVELRQENKKCSEINFLFGQSLHQLLFKGIREIYQRRAKHPNQTPIARRNRHVVKR